MKDPAFLFYPGDWLGGTQWMTHEQKGCYIDLLILQFNTGKFNEAQAKQVLSICFEYAWPMLKQKFIFDGEFYVNDRLRDEIDKRRKYSESRKINGLALKKPKINIEAYAKHMEDENEDENKVKYSSLLMKILVKNEILLPSGFEPLILEWLKYKSEKGQTYKETGLKTFVTNFLKKSNLNLLKASEMVNYSMAQNYSGLFEPKIKETTRATNYPIVGKPDKW